MAYIKTPDLLVRNVDITYKHSLSHLGAVAFSMEEGQCWGVNFCTSMLADSANFHPEFLTTEKMKTKNDITTSNKYLVNAQQKWWLLHSLISEPIIASSLLWLLHAFNIPSSRLKDLLQLLSSQLPSSILPLERPCNSIDSSNRHIKRRTTQTSSILPKADRRFLRQVDNDSILAERRMLCRWPNFAMLVVFELNPANEGEYLFGSSLKPGQVVFHIVGSHGE